MSLPVTQNILDCFDDLITLDGCSDVPSTSGFKMGDIGITKHEIDQYINKEYQSGAELFNAKKRFAINVVANQVHAFLQPKYKLKSLVDSLRVGFIEDNKTPQQSLTNQWVGQEIKIQNKNSFLELFISEVSLFANYTGDVEIRLYNLKTGSILKDANNNDYVFNISSIAGETSTVFPQIKIPLSKKDLDIAIIYNCTGVSPYSVSVLSQGCVSCDPCNRTRYSGVYGITIPNGSEKINASVSYLQYTGGLSIVYSVNCSNNGWMCSVSNLLALPILYKTGSELMNYAFNNSDQMNPKTLGLFNAEKIQKRMDEYEFKYREAMDNVLNNIILPNDSTCFVCERKIIRTTSIP